MPNRDVDFSNVVITPKIIIAHETFFTRYSDLITFSQTNYCFRAKCSDSEFQSEFFFSYLFKIGLKFKTISSGLHPQALSNPRSGEFPWCKLRVFLAFFFNAFYFFDF